MRHWIWTTVWMIVLGKAAFGVSSEYVPIQEKAQGHSLVGGNLTNDSLYSNPAASSFSNVYSIDGSYIPSSTIAVSVLDTKTSGVGGGLGYFRKTYPDSNDVLQSVRISLAGRVAESFGVGITGKMLWGFTGNRDADGNSISGRFNNVDLGVFYNIGVLQLGAVTHNALSENESMKQFREVSVGGRINWQQAMFLSVASQGKVSDGKPEQFSVGAEYVSPYFFSLKGGYRTLPYVAQSYWSMGASFLGPRLGVHYSVEFPNQSGEQTEHVLGANLLF